MKKPNAFTLVELILVILIIILLLFILEPILLTTSRHPFLVPECLSNQCRLTQSWLMYSQDNRDYLIGGDIGQAEYDWINEPISDHDQENKSIDEERETIKKGPLWIYVNDINVYHCPNDRRLFDDGGPYLSYSIVGGLNGQDRYEEGKRNYTVTVKYSQIKKPEEKIVFVEEDAVNGFNPRSWQIYDPDDLNKWTWQDPIAIRHNERSVFGFADGHAFARTVEDERTFEMCEPTDEAKIPGHVEQKGNPDLLWMKQRYTWLPKK